MNVITPIESHPLPLAQTDVDEWIDGLAPYQQATLPNNNPHPDELHEAYQDEQSRNQEWVVFTLPRLTQSTVHVWNIQFGGGFSVDNSEGTFDLLADAIRDSMSDDGDEPATDDIEDTIDTLDTALEQANEDDGEIPRETILQARDELQGSISSD